MPKGKPAKGYRQTRRYKIKTLQELEEYLANNAPEYIEKLEQYTKSFPCPSCGAQIELLDKDVGMYLVNRAMGTPKTRTEVDITHNIALSADQIDGLLYQRFGITIDDVREYIESKKLLTSGTATD